MRLTLAPLVLLAIACEPEDEVIPPIGVWTAPPAATGTAVLPASGTAPVRVAVRAQGPGNVAVPGDVTGITVDGEAVSPSTDGGGVAVVTLTEPGLHTVSAGGSEQVVAVFAPLSDGEAPLDVMPRAVAGEPLVEVVPASGGAVGYSESTVWWIPIGGEPVAALDIGDSTFNSVVSGDVDFDGLTDVLVTSGGSVWVLRGHPTAGFTLAGSVESTERIATSAALGDVNEDGFSDIVVTWEADPRFDFEVWSGDGAFHFELDETVRLLRSPFSVSIADNEGSGRNQITILEVTTTNDANPWSRFVFSKDSYARTGPSVGGVEIDVGYRGQSTDYNGDGSEDLFLYGPRVADVDRPVQRFDLSEVFDASLFSAGTSGAGISFADSNEDGRGDVWIGQQTGEIFIARQVGEDQRQLQVWTAPDGGPIAARDQDADGIPELFVGGDRWWDWAWGSSAPRDGETWWAPAPTPMTFEVGYSVPPAIVRRDAGSSRVDAIGMTESSTAIDLVVTSIFPGAEPQVSELVNFEVSSDNADGVDIAVCGDVVYALTTTEFVAISLASASPVRIGDASVSGGQQIACGDGPSGADVAVLTDAAIDLFESSGLSAGSQALAGAFDIALGGGELATCSTAGCAVAVLGDGTVLTTEDGTLTIGDTAVPGSGTIAVSDPTEDGVGEALVYSGTGVVWVDAAGGELSVRQRGLTDLASDGPVAAVDLFAEGRRVLIGSVGGDLVASTGTVVAMDEAPEE